jgi:hypothetical protein
MKLSVQVVMLIVRNTKIMDTPYVVKTESSRCASVYTEHHTMEAYWGWRYSSMHSLTWALDEVSGQLHAPATLVPGKESQIPIA